MKIPRRPPSQSELLDGFLDEGRLGAIFGASVGPTVRKKYLHWDKLRYRRPPDGLSTEEWWLAIKIARLGLLRELPLCDTAKHHFKVGFTDEIYEHLHHVDRSAAGRIEMADAQIANPSTRDRYIVNSLIEEAITSSQLEGASTTRVVAKDMIRSGRPPRDHGEQMIANNYAAMQRIRSFRGRPLSPEMIFELHDVVTAKTLENPDAAGRLRHVGEDVRVVDSYGEELHSPPPATDLESRMAAMCDFANGTTPDYFLHPVARAVLLHFWLAYDHPFVDGNGRCARALFYWAMLHQGYWLCEFISISEIIKHAPSRYGRAFLYSETDDNDTTYFLSYHLEVVRRAIDELHKHITAKVAGIRETEKLLRRSAGFNHRQLSLLSHALCHPDAEYTITSHKNSHGVVHQTARTDLMALADKGLLEARKVRGTLYYRPAESLEAKLKKLK